MMNDMEKSSHVKITKDVRRFTFEPDPIVSGYIKYLDESPITFDSLKRQIELVSQS